MLRAIEMGFDTPIDLQNDERLVKDGDAYVLTLSAEEIEKENFIEVFAIFDKPNSLKYDLNNDGYVNISDVTKLVNEILEKNPNGN